MRRSLVVLGALVSAAASAGPETKLLKQATERFDAAQKAMKTAAPACRVIEPAFGVAKKNVAALQKGGHRADIVIARTELADLAWTAGARDCSDAVIGNLLATSDILEGARLAWDPKNRAADSAFAPLEVNLNGTFEGEAAVFVSTREFKLSGAAGRPFYFGTRFRSAKSDWTEWVTTSAWTCPTQNFIWPNAFTHTLRSSRLAEEDVANGRFFVHVSAFDEAGHELAFRDGFFVFAPRTALVAAPAALRDCGVSKNDPGCNTEHNGHLPMDEMTFNGFMTAMKNGASDLSRHDLLEHRLPGQALTAQQFGKILDQFSNDSTKLKGAQLAAPFVSDLPRAAGFSSKFEIDYFAGEFTKLVSQGG